MTVRTYAGRHIDAGLGPDGLSAFGYTCQEDCDPPLRELLRMVDIVKNPNYDPELSPDQPFWLPVYAALKPCESDWQFEEAYKDYYFGNPEEEGYPHRLISRELKAVLKNLSDCWANADLTGHDCDRLPTNLLFDDDLNRWVGTYALLFGTLRIEVYAVISGGEEHWYAEYFGCPTAGPNVAELTVECLTPIRAEGGVVSAVAFGCCGNPATPPDPGWGLLIRLAIQGLSHPLFIGRHIDEVSDSGSGSGTPFPVYGVADCCGVDDCPIDPGCCNNPVRINEDIDFTFSDVTLSCELASNCTAEDLTVDATDTSGCTSWRIGTPPTFPGDPDPNGYCLQSDLCLECDSDESVDEDSRGWQHYRLKVHDPGALNPDFYVEPVDGSCDPFFLTFEVTQTLLSLATGYPPEGVVCDVSYTVTVTN